MKTGLETTYKAAIYLRLSKEDGDLFISGGKSESDSIANQRALLTEFVEGCPDITLRGEWADDGYTGTNFARPGFEGMMEAVRKGEINCVIVKDLSRFGREYIGSGRYIEKIFPKLGVRFIAVNDNYDSEGKKGSDDSFVLPFKNLVNDSYCRDTSIKVRSHLEMKRRKGEFIANFAAYGYQRAQEERNRLQIDEAAARTVRDIFKWAIGGMSAKHIAERLNETGVPSPMEHKKACGLHYQTPFRYKPQTLWSATAVLRILKNPVYTGTLIQGKRSTPNYKVKKTVLKPESDWAVTGNAHEAIIPEAQFALAQQILSEDRRVAPQKEAVYPFSGRIYCGDCKSPMVRKTVSRQGKRYTYYICSASKADKTACSKHSIRLEPLEEAVLAAMRAQVSAALDLEKALKQMDGRSLERYEIQKAETQIRVLRAGMERNQGLLLGLYEDLKDGVIDQGEYSALKPQFAQRVQRAKESISALEKRREEIEKGPGRREWLDQFEKFAKLSILSRQAVVELVERIEIFEEKRIEVVFRYQDQFAEAFELLQR